MNVKKMILHVEDSADTREIVKLILEKEGYIVYSVEDGESGLRALKKLKPNLMLVDIMLPGMTGWEFVKAAREKVGKTPAIIMLSALEITVEHRKSLQKYGVTGYVTKPFTVETLLRAVHSAIKSG